MELMRYLSMHDLQLAIHLKPTKPLGGLANEIQDDPIHCRRKMIMEAIKRKHYKSASLPATPIKGLLASTLYFRTKIKMSRWV